MNLKKEKYFIILWVLIVAGFIIDGVLKQGWGWGLIIWGFLLGKLDEGTFGK